MMNLIGIRNPFIRRTAAIAALPIGAVGCFLMVMFNALCEYSRMIADTPEEFMRVWRGLPPPASVPKEQP